MKKSTYLLAAAGLAIGLAGCNYCSKEKIPAEPAQERVEKLVQDASIEQKEPVPATDASYAREDYVKAFSDRFNSGCIARTWPDESIKSLEEAAEGEEESLFQMPSKCDEECAESFDEVGEMIGDSYQQKNKKAKPIPGVGVFEEICPGLYGRTFPNPKAPEFNTNYGNRTVVRGEFDDDDVSELLKKLELKVERKGGPKRGSDDRTSYKLNEEGLYLWVDLSYSACQKGYTLLTFFAQHFLISEKETYKQRVDSLISKTEDILAPVEEVK